MFASASRLARVGIAIAITEASSAIPAPIRSPVLKPASVGIEYPPRSVLIWARTTPTTAAANDVPMERVNVLKLFAEAVSVMGTEPMIRAGIESGRAHD